MIRTKTNNTIHGIVLLTAIFVCATNISQAQTVYKQQKGFFTSLPSFSLQGSGNNSEFLFGPMVEYRFSESTDIVFHSEYFSSNTPDFSLINLGIKGGHTIHENNFYWRNEIGLYRAFNLITSENTSPTPKAFTINGTTTAYYSLKTTDRIYMLPYAGMFAYYGTLNMPITRTNYLSGHEDGFIYGPRVGLDININFSRLFTWTVGAGYAHAVSNNYSPNYDGFILTLQFNF